MGPRKIAPRIFRNTAAPSMAGSQARPPGIVQRVLEAQNRERAVIVAEILQVKGMMPLLMKHRNGDRWSRDERRQLRQQLQALADLSPYLFVMVLPGSVLILPALAWWLDRRRQRRA